MARKHPTQDPYRADILRALDEQKLDGEKFEYWMNDVLRAVYPNLVPVTGGSDFGQDGEGVTKEGKPFSLVATTEADVIGNLTGSLDQLAAAEKPRKVVLVTSQALTPRRRKNLEDRAQEKGFDLLQIVERDGVVNHLYHRPDALRDLLGLTGRPRALSTVPMSRRPQLPVPLLGRDGDLVWLRQRAGEEQKDCVLAGEPGSGKTYLLSRLVDEDEGWFFLVDGDREAVANALREIRPRVVIVDDAHVRPEALERLRHRRHQSGQRFAIVAATWMGAKDEVREALGARSGAVRKLEGLTRNELLELFRSLHLGASDDELKELIDQSGNKPGLAVTLALLWREGAREEIWTGEALIEHLAPLYRGLLEEDPLVGLAAFALGGDTGVTVEDVATVLGKPKPTLFEQASKLAVGGVLSERGDQRLSVMPRTLRSALLGRVFFGAGPALNYEPFLEVVPSREDAILELVLAQRRGAMLDMTELTGLVLSTDNAKVWAHFASIGETQARLTLEQFPGRTTLIARATLGCAPTETVLCLLEEAAQTFREPHQDSGHPLRVLEAGLLNLSISPNARLRVRRVIVETVGLYLGRGGSRSVAARAVAVALSPRLEDVKPDPGSGERIEIRRRMIEVQEIREMPVIVQQACEVVAEHELYDGETAKLLDNVLWHWLHPSSNWFGNTSFLSEPLLAATREISSQLLGCLFGQSTATMGLRLRLQSMGREIGLTLDIAPSPLLEALYPERPKVFDEVQLGDLAQRLAEESPQKAIHELIVTRREAEKADRLFSNNEQRLIRVVATLVQAPTEWLKELSELDAPLDWMGPFLRVLAETDRPEFVSCLNWLADVEEYGGVVLNQILVSVELPTSLVRRGLRVARVFLSTIEVWCLRGEVSPHVLKELFKHDDWQVALSAAYGHWKSEPRHQVSPELREYWERALLNVPFEVEETELSSRGDRFHQILSTESALAVRWFEERFREINDGRETAPVFVGESVEVMRGLDAHSKEELLAALPEELAWQFAPGVVDRDREMLRKFLGESRLRSSHLWALQGPLDREWRDLAVVALDFGYTAQEVASGADREEESWWGPESAHWMRKRDAFEALLHDPDPRVQEVARHGAAKAQRRIDQALEGERKEQLRGLHDRGL